VLVEPEVQKRQGRSYMEPEEPEAMTRPQKSLELVVEGQEPRSLVPVVE